MKDSLRGFSDFGYSFVYVIFEDGTDPYWARTRVLEYLSKITPQLPPGVKTELGPDAKGVKIGKRVAVGGGSPVAGTRSMPDPVADVAVMDISSVRHRSTSCAVR